MEKLYKIRNRTTGLFFSGNILTKYTFGHKGKIYKSLDGCRSELDHIKRMVKAYNIDFNPDVLEMVEFSLKEEGIVN